MSRQNPAHIRARERYLRDRGPAARRRKAAERAAERREVHRFDCGHRSSSSEHPCQAVTS